MGFRTQSECAERHLAWPDDGVVAAAGVKKALPWTSQGPSLTPLCFLSEVFALGFSLDSIVILSGTSLSPFYGPCSPGLCLRFGI